MIKQTCEKDEMFNSFRNLICAPEDCLVFMPTTDLLLLSLRTVTCSALAGNRGLSSEHIPAIEKENIHLGTKVGEKRMRWEWDVRAISPDD